MTIRLNAQSAVNHGLPLSSIGARANSSNHASEASLSGIANDIRRRMVRTTLRVTALYAERRTGQKGDGSAFTAHPHAMTRREPEPRIVEILGYNANMGSLSLSMKRC